MSEHELLKFAAIAAGIADGDHFYDMDLGKEWNPLTDDGDALRLAVKLGIGLDFVRGLLVITSTNRRHEDCRNFDGNLIAATRYAIVCAAAEIGGAKP